MAKHYIEVSDPVWKEFSRVSKEYKIDKRDLLDDVIALAGDLDAIAEQHKVDTTVPYDNGLSLFSDTRAAVLQPSASELEELI